MGIGWGPRWRRMKALSFVSFPSPCKRIIHGKTDPRESSRVENGTCGSQTPQIYKILAGDPFHSQLASWVCLVPWKFQKIFSCERCYMWKRLFGLSSGWGPLNFRRQHSSMTADSEQKLKEYRRKSSLKILEPICLYKMNRNSR